jgi:hypothetical protein
VTTVLVPPARVALYDGSFTLIGPLLSAANVARNYLLMQPTQCSFEIKMDDDLAVQCDPRLGRLVVVTSTAYPYPWVGYIVTVAWAPKTDVMKITCRGLDAIFSERPLPADYSVAGPAGYCVGQVIDQANADNPTGIGHRAPLSSGPRRQLTLSDRTVYAVLTMISRQCAYEWWVEYNVGQGSFSANVQFAPERGDDMCDGYVLQFPQTVDWTDAQLDMAATYYAVTLVGGSASVNQAYGARPRVRAVNNSRFTKASTDVVAQLEKVHGHNVEHSALLTTPVTRRERIYLSELLKDSGDIGDAVGVMLMRPPAAERTLRLSALPIVDDNNPTDPVWKNLAIGNIVGLTIPNQSLFFGGFNGCVRIIGVQPKETTGVCDLVVQVLGPHVDRVTVS